MPKNAQLIALAQRRNLRVPAAECRVDRRGLWQFFEVRERWEGRDPKSYTEVVAWFRGTSDRPGKPRGAQFWLDLCAHCGQDRAPYDEVSVNDPMKITVEHWYSQSMAGDRHGLLHGWMNLHAVEWGFNNSLDFKSSDSPAEQQFLGLRAYRMHRSFLNWFNTKPQQRVADAFLPAIDALHGHGHGHADLSLERPAPLGLDAPTLPALWGGAGPPLGRKARARGGSSGGAGGGGAGGGGGGGAGGGASAGAHDARGGNANRSRRGPEGPQERHCAVRGGARPTPRRAAGQPGSGARRGRGCQQRPGGRLGGRGRQGDDDTEKRRGRQATTTTRRTTRCRPGTRPTSSRSRRPPLAKVCGRESARREAVAVLLAGLQGRVQRCAATGLHVLRKEGRRGRARDRLHRQGQALGT